MYHIVLGKRCLPNIKFSKEVSEEFVISSIKNLCTEYREILVYLVVGVLTTIFSWIACLVCERLFLDPSVTWQNAIINTIGWVAGVCFSYPLNRRFVFQSSNPHICREFAGFASTRLSTWILDLIIMELTVNMLNIHYWIAKIFISSVIVTILNYVFSKIFIFKK